MIDGQTTPGTHRSDRADILPHFRYGICKKVGPGDASNRARLSEALLSVPRLAWPVLFQQKLGRIGDQARHGCSFYR